MKNRVNRLEAFCSWGYTGHNVGINVKGEDGKVSACFDLTSEEAVSLAYQLLRSVSEAVHIESTIDSFFTSD